MIAPRRRSEIEVRDAVTEPHLPDLMRLFASAWWAEHRTPDDVRRMLAASTIVVALVDRQSDRLVGFARVLTDFTYTAMIMDVVVDPDFRGTGLGATLMDAVVAHPRLATVASVELVCQPELRPFYRRWGFSENVGRSALMRRPSTTASAAT
jgi:predicted GNAT family N-acyltransferase